MSRSARRPFQRTKRIEPRGFGATASFVRRSLAYSIGAALMFGVAMHATHAAAQEDGPIAIAGNAETNPAAVAEMAQRLAAPSKASAPVAQPAVQYTPPSGYRAATQAADAAMRNAARALEARAEAADQSMDAADDASGMIVIPGPGQQQPKPAIAAAPVVRPQPVASGMMKTSFSPAASRDVVPVVITRDSGATAATKPIAAAAANPVVNRAVVAQPQPQSGAFQDGESIRATALAFLQQQAAGLPGKVDITVTQVFPRGLAPCSSLDPFMPTGARLWGRVTVGVRCVGEKPWTMYVQARVSINATYYLAARALAPGDVLTNADLVAHDGDLTMMPQAVITDPSQAVGATALGRVAAGLPLRSDMLRASSAVSVGQAVHVVADGTGFAISAEGSVMNNASPGQQVRVKTAGGQIITGIVRDSQTVEIRM
ncbi:flagellar basal body P-ring formation chaperone FlgA [Caballeronia sp. BR00000012568055]|uniref:flagellar basal body P-ring formation chaperone FlgA n=1 Tax=Caballeronia sp. BR00000012568055 TaxID=2918761 RepID=UPI0023F8D622|nr:flagellar basal body P-ring formation chaperone FlgA [Caballeronia sp. BR00000012568055]